MAQNLDQFDSYEKVKTRLDQIVETVSDGSLPLDEALDLYEEAVKLGMRASDMIELAPAAPEAVEADAEAAASDDTDANAADAAAVGEPDQA